MNLVDLDAETREYMRTEVLRDTADGSLYLSPRLSAKGRAEYEELLLAAVSDGSPESLASDLASLGRLNEMETTTRKGQTYSKRVPVNAAETLAEGEFNRFYARGLCARVVYQGGGSVRVYRAKEVSSPRTESETMLGTVINAEALLNDLRTSTGVEPALGLPPGPNSGLSVQLAAPMNL
jgi:hypothetical protein